MIIGEEEALIFGFSHHKMKFVKKYKIEIIVIFLFILLRLPDLGHDMFNTDVFKWKSRTYDFSTGIFTLDFEKTIQKYHPGVTLMWIGTAGIKFFNLYYDLTTGASPADNLVHTVFALHTLQKFLVLLVTAVIAGFTLHPLKKLFGTKYAVVVSVLLLTEPFYIALNRVMHLEGLMSTFMLASFVWFFYYLKEGTTRRIIFSAFLASCAFLTKTSSLFLVPFFALVIFLEAVFKTQNSSQFVLKDFANELWPAVKKYLIWLGITLLFFVLLWPAMWTHAKLALETLYRGIFTVGIERDHAQLFLGNWVSDPGPFYYPVVLAFRLSVWLLAGVLGFSLFYKKMKLDQNRKQFVIYSLIFVVFYIIELSIPSKKLDRYILPAILSLILLAAFFYEHVFFEIIRKFKNASAVFILLMGLLIGGTIIYLHPYYLSYYSPLLGGLQNGIYGIEPKWMIGQNSITNYFEKEVLKTGELERFKPDESLDSKLYTAQIDQLLTVGFQEKYYTQIWPFMENIGARATIKDISVHAEKSNYFVYPVYDDDSYLEDRVLLEYVTTLKLRGVDLYNVYKKVGNL